MNHAEGKERKDKTPVQITDMTRDAIATLAMTEQESDQNRMSTRTKDMKDVNDIDQGRKDSLEKRILITSQTTKAPESLHCPESRKSTSEDNVIQEEMKLSKKRIKFVINDNIR